MQPFLRTNRNRFYEANFPGCPCTTIHLLAFGGFTTNAVTAPKTSPVRSSPAQQSGMKSVIVLGNGRYDRNMVFQADP
jgi:hypothetical protein